MIKYISFFTFLVFLISCNSGSWSRTNKKALIKKCRAEGGSKDYCNCYLEKAMEKYPIASDMDKIDFETAVELSLNCEK